MVDMVAFRDADPTAREAAATIATLKRAPQRGRDRPSPGADLDEPAVGILSHHDTARIARDALRRFRGNARPVFEDGLARVVGVGEDPSVDVNDHLVPLARCAGVDPVMERRLSEKRQGIGLLLRERWRF